MRDIAANFTHTPANSHTLGGSDASEKTTTVHKISADRITENCPKLSKTAQNCQEMQKIKIHEDSNPTTQNVLELISGMKLLLEVSHYRNLIYSDLSFLMLKYSLLQYTLF